MAHLASVCAHARLVLLHDHSSSGTGPWRDGHSWESCSTDADICANPLPRSRVGADRGRDGTEFQAFSWGRKKILELCLTPLKPLILCGPGQELST